MADEERYITLKFIEDYRSFPQLWDPNNKLYTNKKKRIEALQVLATKYSMDIDGVKKKIKSLRSYFSKEHKKVKKRKSGAGSDDLYHSSWFAYKHLLFIADSVTPRDTKESSSEEEEYPLADLYNNEESAGISQSFVSEDEHEFVLPQIRNHSSRNTKTTKIDDKEEAAYQFIKRSEQLRQKDEFTIYGQLIAHKIRNLNSFNRLIAQQRINNILFELEMEQMTNNVTEMSNATKIPM